MNRMRSYSRIVAGLAWVGCAWAQTQTVMQTVNAQINPIGKVSVPASLNLTSTGALFTPYTGSLTVSYRMRSTSSGTGNITVQAGSDFTPAGGPSIAGGVLSYTCGNASLGAGGYGCSTVSTTAQTGVVTVSGASCTGGGGACSSVDPNVVQVNFSLQNNSNYTSATVSASLTFNISAL